MSANSKAIPPAPAGQSFPTIDPGAHLVGRRVIFVFEVKDRTGDRFFNGISGYRAQYYTSPNHGLSQNRLLIDRLTPLLVEIAKARDFRKGDEVMTEDEVRASLALESAKAWGNETGDREFWSHVNGYKNRDDIEINARRWAENLGSTDIKTKRGAQRGVRAPRLRAIKIMGGFADQHGNEDVAEHKRRRHHDIHERGFS